DLTSANDKEIITDYGLGRNCQLFEQTRKWAYRAIRQGWPAYDQWLQACFERAKAYNFQLLQPLDEKEVWGIAKSIAKWTHSKFSQESFNDYVLRTHSPEIQSKRGKMSKGGGRKSKIGRPWLTMGISRATWYRKKDK
ncbi:primase C-terminal domain-containing protein, partial [Providencia manganoxydans]